MASRPAPTLATRCLTRDGLVGRRRVGLNHAAVVGYRDGRHKIAARREGEELPAGKRRAGRHVARNNAHLGTVVLAQSHLRVSNCVSPRSRRPPGRLGQLQTPAPASITLPFRPIRPPHPPAKSRFPSPLASEAWFRMFRDIDEISSFDRSA